MVEAMAVRVMRATMTRTGMMVWLVDRREVQAMASVSSCISRPKMRIMRMLRAKLRGVLYFSDRLKAFGK